MTTLLGVLAYVDEVAMLGDKGEFAAFRSQVGSGLRSDSNGRAENDEANGLEDGETPGVAFPATSTSQQTAVIEAELALCMALANWEPWSTPSAQLIQAMDQVQRNQGTRPATVDITTMCMRRSQAITEMAYEDTHGAHMPEMFRYRKLARFRLMGTPRWGNRARFRNPSTQGQSLCSSYFSVSKGIQSVEALTML